MTTGSGSPHHCQSDHLRKGSHTLPVICSKPSFSPRIKSRHLVLTYSLLDINWPVAIHLTTSPFTLPLTRSALATPATLLSSRCPACYFLREVFPVLPLPYNVLAPYLHILLPHSGLCSNVT